MKNIRFWHISLLLIFLLSNSVNSEILDACIDEQSDWSQISTQWNEFEKFRESGRQFARDNYQAYLDERLKRINQIYQLSVNFYRHYPESKYFNNNLLIMAKSVLLGARREEAWNKLLDEILASKKLAEETAMHFYSIKLDGLLHILRTSDNPAPIIDEMEIIINEYHQRYQNIKMTSYFWINIAREIERYSSEWAKAIYQKVITLGDENMKLRAKGLLRQMDILGKELDIKFTAIDGREIDLSQMKGKVILINFWATWCYPCVVNIPELKQAYDRFHDEGFEIIGISLDVNRDKLIEMIEEKDIPWPQYFDGNTWDNKFALQFGILSVPTKWLLDKNGKVVNLDAGRNLSENIFRLLKDEDTPLYLMDFPDEESYQKAYKEFYEIYKLAENQNVKYIGPQYTKLRRAYMYQHGRESGVDALTVIFHQNDELYINSISHTVNALETLLFDLYPFLIKGDRTLLNKNITGDFIIRNNTTLEKILPQLEKIFQNEFNIPVRLVLKETTEKVWIIKGNLNFLSWENGNIIKIYGREVNPLGGYFSINTGTINEFIDDLTKNFRRLRSQILNESIGFNDKPISWQMPLNLHIDFDPELIFQNITRQTGLIFEQEERIVQRLFIEKL